MRACVFAGMDGYVCSTYRDHVHAISKGMEAKCVCAYNIYSMCICVPCWCVNNAHAPMRL